MRKSAHESGSNPEAGSRGELSSVTGAVAGSGAVAGAGTGAGAGTSSSSRVEHQVILMAVYNMKGGVAKTTSTLEFGYHLAKDGMKVLLVDADMQANLTTNIIMASTAVEGAHPLLAAVVPKSSAEAGDISASKESVEEADEEAVDPEITADEAYDRMWKLINQDEKKEGLKRTFHSILKEFTETRLQLVKKDIRDETGEITDESILKKIKPLSVELGDGSSLDYIAGHMLTAGYEDKIAAGFKSTERSPIPGMVTNVFREFAQQNGYDFVIFDLGCTLTATVTAVLLGVDYIVSPFKCERSCRTAAEIVLKKIRDWHLKTIVVDGKRVDNPDCALQVKDRTPRARPHEVDMTLKCYPIFLGAFPVAVKLVKGVPVNAYLTRMREIFDRYKEDLQGFTHGLTRVSLDKLEKCMVENSESTGREAEGGGVVLPISSLPCVSWFHDALMKIKTRNDLRTRSFKDKSRRISQQYRNVLKALYGNMTEFHQRQLAAKSRGLFNGGAEASLPALSGRKRGRAEYESAAAMSDDGLGRPLAKRDRLDDTLSLFVPPRRTFRSGKTIITDMPGYEFQNVVGDGNCFFYAAAHQLEQITHPLLDAIPEGTEVHNYLRLQAQGAAFKDYEFVDYQEVIQLARAIKVVIAIVSISDPRHDTVYHYVDDADNYQSSLDSSELPEGVSILYLGLDATGVGHYYSVLSSPLHSSVVAELG